MKELNISPRELYDMSAEDVLKLKGYALNSLENGILKQVFINKEYISITEEGALNWYPYYKEDGTEVERVASYTHNITYYFGDTNKFVKSEEWEYYINSTEETSEWGYGFGAYCKEVDDLSEEEDYSKKENCENLQDFWEIIRDEFINPYYNEWKVNLYDNSLMECADENFEE